MFAVRARQRSRLLSTLRQYPTIASAYPFGEDVHVSDIRANVEPQFIMTELQAYLAAHGIDDARIREKAPGIEDAFIELMGRPPEVAA